MNKKQTFTTDMIRQIDIKNSLIFKLAIGLAFIIISTNSYGQDYYYFKPWKSKLQIPTEGLIILVDSASTEKGTDFLTKIATHVKS
ncbi:MAG: hypothetical protein VXW38_10300, partial [Bacteroidota bacterium]|nr:hypothetical protein [Bacteroidota bacterium]